MLQKISAIQDTLVVNVGAPELNHLASAVAQSGHLQKYIRPYANLGRPWESKLGRLPGLGKIFLQNFGRRDMPAGLNASNVVEVGVVADLTSALARKVKSELAGVMHRRVQKIVSITGAEYAKDAALVVGSNMVSELAFKATKGRKVLNYSNAHHNFIRKFVNEEMELEPSFALTLPDLKRWQGGMSERLDYECSAADMILTGSSFARNSFISEGFPAGKLVAIPYGTDVTMFTPSQTPHDSSDGLFRTLFVGQIGQRKGMSYLLRGYEAFRGAGTSLTLVGNYYGAEEALRPFSEIFEHIPHLPRARLPDVYRNADVFVFPSLIEGLGLVVLEAMASGLPVITTPNGPGDLVRDGIDGFVVPIRDADAIAEKLEYLRVNPDERHRLGVNARERALEFTWRNYGIRVLDALEAVRSGSAASVQLEDGNLQ